MTDTYGQPWGGPVSYFYGASRRWRREVIPTGPVPPWGQTRSVWHTIGRHRARDAAAYADVRARKYMSPHR